METHQESVTEILPPIPIRVETAISRFPVHRLAKHGDIGIDIKEKNEHGDIYIKWEADYSKKHGQPGPMAYKIDTLIINRRIEESPRPIPKIIRLGSLREIAQELGISTHATDSIRRALRQNAGALISAKIRYRKADGSERTLEADFTRYSVVLTGEELPDGRKADAVYIVLNDIYMQVLNGAMTRPLDYAYLRALPPAPQRFYEILSYRMYATIKNDRARAKLLYSEFCTYAPLVRQYDWNVVRPQMARIHAPHIKSGYIAKIDIQDTTDSDGQPDWLMFYQPGPKARADFRAFQKGGGPVMLEAEPLTVSPPALAALPLAEPEQSPQEGALIAYGITPAKAAELARQHDAAAIDTYIDYLEWEMAKKPGKIADPAAWLFSAFKDGRGKPKGFLTKAESQAREEAKQAKGREQAEQKRREREAEARERAERQKISEYLASLTPEQQAEHDAAAITQAAPGMRESLEGPLKSLGLTLLRSQHAKHVLQQRGILSADA